MLVFWYLGKKDNQSKVFGSLITLVKFLCSEDESLKERSMQNKLYRYFSDQSEYEDSNSIIVKTKVIRSKRINFSELDANRILTEANGSL